MVSHSGRYVIAYNGEIYNCMAIRKDLESTNINWRGHSDTEILVEAFEQWGIDKTLQKIRGMFAIALWDREELKLTLIRDRIGKKPLYYGLHRGELIFSSEIRAFRGMPEFRASLSREAIAEYLRLSYVPAPLSILKGFFKLQPGHRITFSKRELSSGNLPATVPWWSLEATIFQGQHNEIEATDADVLEDLERVLSTAVRERLLGDVPIGAFLSGGIDSSLVVSLMQQASINKVKTFSIGFSEHDYDESEYASAVAAHIGTDHTEMIVTPSEAMAVIPDMASVFDEPFADASQVPTFLVSKLARNSVTVALSGDGGDELFCGYNRYVWGSKLWHRLQSVPPSLRSIAGSILQRVPPNVIDGGANLLNAVPGVSVPRQISIKLHKSARAMNARTLSEFYDLLVATFDNPESILADQFSSNCEQLDQTVASSDPVTLMMYWDQKNYLPDDILVKVDRTSMAVGLEARAPLLDKNVIEFVWRIPKHLKYRDGEGKWILRRLLERFVPSHLFDRPKSGFAIPMGDWIRSDLRDWADELLTTNSMGNREFLNQGAVNSLWSQHVTGRQNNIRRLWTLLMLQQWIRQNQDILVG